MYVCSYGTGGTAVQNESSYIVALPPCVWGSAAEGLRAPPAIRLDSNLSCIKRSNSTYGHWGDMALWQMRGAYLRTNTANTANTGTANNTANTAN